MLAGTTGEGEMTSRNRAQVAVAIRAASLASAYSSTAQAAAARATAAAARATAAAVGAAWQQVSAVLSDGPDLDSDPVGHADPQIRPHRKSSGSAKEALAVASKKLNTICPGAAS